MRVHAYFRDADEAKRHQAKLKSYGYISGRVSGGAHGAWLQFPWSIANVEIIPRADRVTVKLLTNRVSVAYLFDADRVQLEPSSV